MVRYSAAYRKRISDAARMRGKRSALVTAQRCATQEIDADTLRQRALYDRRGTPIIVGQIKTEAGPMPCQIQWSSSGRTDQADLIVEGKIIATKRLSLILESLLKCTHQ